MDWTALVGPGALTAGALAAGVIAKTWFDMRRGAVEVRAAQRAADKAARTDAVEEWRALLSERDARIDRQDAKLARLEADLDAERDRSAECERRAAVTNDRLWTVVHACRNAGITVPEWDDHPSATHKPLPEGRS